MIRFENVSKKFTNGSQALDHVNFEISKGEMVFLVGPSSAGKSTILNLIALLDACTQGQIYLDGSNLSQVTPSLIPYIRRTIGVIFQNTKLLHDRNIFHNVALPLIVANYHSREISRRVHAALDQVDLLKKVKLLPVSLSDDEKQRVGVARALVNNPRVLLADEPTGNLDAKLSLEFMHWFEQFNRYGVTILIATHNTRMTDSFKQRKIKINQGHIVHGD